MTLRHLMQTRSDLARLNSWQVRSYSIATLVDCESKGYITLDKLHIMQDRLDAMLANANRIQPLLEWDPMNGLRIYNPYQSEIHQYHYYCMAEFLRRSKRFVQEERHWPQILRWLLPQQLEHLQPWELQWKRTKRRGSKTLSKSRLKIQLCKRNVRMMW